MTNMTRQTFLEKMLRAVAGGLLIGAGWGGVDRQSAGQRLGTRVLPSRSGDAAVSGVTVEVETYADETFFLVVRGFDSYLPLVEQPRGITLWSAADAPLVCFPIAQATEVGDTAVFELSSALSREVASFEFC